MSAVRVGVLASGSGTNLQALLDAGDPAWRVAAVICDREAAGALDRAGRAGVPARYLPRGPHPSREAHEAAVVEALRAEGVEWVALAGYMRLVGPTLRQAWPNRVLNIHPSLLPAFPGLDAIGQAFAAGVKVAGCTVHFVDEGCDTGPIIAQAAVPVLPEDDVDRLRARVLAEEHRLYPWVLARATRGELAIEGRKVRVG